MSTTFPQLDAITGVLLIATWASSLLYMAELLQALYYFRTFKKDNWKLKSYVAVAFTIDTISVVADYACVYLYTITHAGDLVYLTKQNWAVPLHFISTTCVAFLVQSFLAFLYWRFTENTIMKTPIICFLSILSLAAFGVGIYSTLTIILFPAVKDRNKMRISGIVYIVTQVSADLIIAGALLLELMKAKSLFKGERRVNNMLNRLVLHTIQTGTVTAVIAMLALIALALLLSSSVVSSFFPRFLIDNKNNISIGTAYLIGRVYILSMLSNLNIRDSSRSQNWTTSSGQRGTVRFAHGTTYNFSTLQFCPSEPDSSSGSVKSSVLLPTSQFPASILGTQPPEIEMMPIDTKHVPEV
ncbi:hypothetical protein MSAN_00889000 [Mycena sanguinolenta]|uniref:DUF6534 domain-containing protein n=1 Tax=Mycena sanguinolenta TaxID=230812 RepID=A0A8H7DBU0_9AGAR|nr:hypothetical protein MSAN_00889000 [Mycena sanguinolenta]